MADPRRFEIKDDVSLWPGFQILVCADRGLLYLLQSLKSLRFAKETTLRRTRAFLKVWRSVTFALARLKKGDKQRLARQKKSINTYASVRYHYLKSGCRIQRLCSGDSGIVFAVQTPFKTRYLACSCWLQLVWRRSNDMIWLRLIGSVQWQNWVCDKEKRCFSLVLVRKSRQRYFEPHLTAFRELYVRW